jgi:hypothetical protein
LVLDGGNHHGGQQFTSTTCEPAIYGVLVTERSDRTWKVTWSRDQGSMFFKLGLG